MRNEFRLAVRMLIRRPVMSAAIIATIGLALAATTVAFGVVNGVLLQPLPYGEPDRLVAIWERNTVHDGERNVVSPANFIAWKEGLKSFDRLAGIVAVSAAVTGDGEPEQVGAMIASASYFAIVGANPLIGRFYTEEEDVDGGSRVTVLSEGYWRRRYGSDPQAVGKTIIVNGNPNQIIGVLPAGFDFTPRFRFGGTGTRDLWLPPQFGARSRTWGGRYLQVVGRLAPGVSFGAGKDEATRFAARLRQLYPERQEGWEVALFPLHEEIVGDVRTTVLVVFAAVCFVLLIACSNVANLLLTRATERHQEMAVRVALGAGRARLFRQLLAESFVLSSLGGALGLALAAFGIRALVRSAPDLPRLDRVGLDGTVIGFALLAMLGTAVLFGLAPAAQLTGRDLATWLTQRGSSGRRHAHRLRSLFVGAQVALSFILLVGAGLLVRSLVNRLAVNVGFPLEGKVTAELSLAGGLKNEERSIRFDQIVERVAAVPGVASASAGSIVPMSGDGQSTTFEIVGRPAPPTGQAPVADVRFIHRDYIRTMGIPLLAGHLLGPDDRAGLPVHVLVNETGARLNWPGESALGKQIRMEWGDTVVAEVVGIVGDVRLNGPDGAETKTTLYWDHRQVGESFKMTLVVRTDLPPESVVPAIRAAVHEIDPKVPLYNIRTLGTLLTEAVARSRFTTVALGAFALLALTLAALGLYAVMAYATQQREREIGIRMALGADRSSVLAMVLRQGVGVVGPALVLGAVGAVVLARFIQSLMFGVSPADPITFAGVALLLGLAGFLACWLPARRASSIDPVKAIRAE